MPRKLERVRFCSTTTENLLEPQTAPPYVSQVQSAQQRFVVVVIAGVVVTAVKGFALEGRGVDIFEGAGRRRDAGCGCGVRRCLGTGTLGAAADGEAGERLIAPRCSRTRSPGAVARGDDLQRRQQQRLRVACNAADNNSLPAETSRKLLLTRAERQHCVSDGR